MNQIPVAALLLGIAGLVPFLLGASVSLGMFDSIDVNTNSVWILARDGPLLMLRYGVIILCFMSGVLWGFACNATGTRGAICFALSVIPALWIFLNPGNGASSALINLMIGFAAVLLIDVAFWRWQLAPPWWLSLRLPLSVIVLICLAIGVWA